MEEKNSKIRENKLGNELYTNLIKARSFENTRVDSKKVDELVKKMISIQDNISKNTEIMRAYYTVIDRDAKQLETQIIKLKDSEKYADLIQNVKDSHKHFHLFLQQMRINPAYNNYPKGKKHKALPKNKSDDMIAMMDKFIYEIIYFNKDQSDLDKLKAQKEQLFPYSNAELLDDFKKINSLSYIIKLLKKKDKTEPEKLKIQQFLECVKENANNENSSPVKNSLKEPDNKDDSGSESPTLKKLKNLNKTYYSDIIQKYTRNDGNGKGD